MQYLSFVKKNAIFSILSIFNSLRNALGHLLARPL